MFLKNNLGGRISITDLGIVIPIEGIQLNWPLRRITRSKQLKDRLQKKHLTAELSSLEMADPNFYVILEIDSSYRANDRSIKNPARAFIREVKDAPKPPIVDFQPSTFDQFEELDLVSPNALSIPTNTIGSPPELLRAEPSPIEVSIKRSNIKRDSATHLNKVLKQFSRSRKEIPLARIVNVSNEIKTRAKTLGNYVGYDVGVFSMGGLGDDIVRTNTIKIIRDSLPWRDVYITYYHRNASNLLKHASFIDLDIPLGSRHLINDSRDIRELANHDIYIDLRYVGKTYVNDTIPFQSIASNTPWEKNWKKYFDNHPVGTRELIKHTAIHYRELLPRTLGFEFSSFGYPIQSSETSLLDQIPRPYVVVSNGTDQTLESNIQTKQLDTDHLSIFCSKLMSQGWNIVEVGLPKVNPIPIAGTYNLIGKTNFEQLCSVLSNGTVTICNEGGVAHLSTFLRVPALVAFGPTSSTFWGYSENENLVSDECSNCWLTISDWYLYCPKRNHCCMRSLTPNLLYDAFERLCDRYGLRSCV